MTAVVPERQDPNMILGNPVIDGVGKTRHEITPDAGLNDMPPVSSILNDVNGMVCRVEKLCSEGGSPPFIELSRLD